MKISILAPDLSCRYGNCMSRAYLLAKILNRKYKVEIVGFTLGDGVWKPIANDPEIEYKFVSLQDLKSGAFNQLRSEIKQLINKIDGDIIYASKPLLSSFGVGLLSKFSQKRPILLDIDDWQMGIRKETHKGQSLSYRWKDITNSVFEIHKTSSYWNNFIGEGLTSFADDITVVSSFLQKKFGGSVIRHPENREAFNPENFNKAQLRDELGISQNKKLIMFCGTPRKHKGVEDLVEAVSLLEDPDVTVTIVGNDGTSYSKQFLKFAQEKLGDRLLVFGLQPHEKVPQFLAISDLVAIPQRYNFATVGQIPIKVFDAMAAAKPVVASKVSDLPEILEGCGWLVEPQQPAQLSDAIQYALEHSEEAETMGHKAREKYKKHYSGEVMENLLVNLLQKYE